MLVNVVFPGMERDAPIQASQSIHPEAVATAIKQPADECALSIKCDINEDTKLTDIILSEDSPYHKYDASCLVVTFTDSSNVERSLPADGVHISRKKLLPSIVYAPLRLEFKVKLDSEGMLNLKVEPLGN